MYNSLGIHSLHSSKKNKKNKKNRIRLKSLCRYFALVEILTGSLSQKHDRKKMFLVQFIFKLFPDRNFLWSENVISSLTWHKLSNQVESR